MKVFALTSVSLVAFALNSILCRAALGSGEADAAGFTAIRIFSGAAALAAILLTRAKTQTPRKRGNWLSGFFLFLYAAAFSFAYLGLNAGTGALILFGCVQLSMVGVSWFRDRRPLVTELLGAGIAFAGLVYLVLPGLSTPPFESSLLMAVAGVAWGFYSLRGKGSEDPLGDTAGNFARALPWASLILLIFISHLDVSTKGALLAVVSGSVSSGIGYAFWYSALKYHTATRAAAMQLMVPVIAALGGVLLLAETVSLRLLIAGALILGGIGLTFLRRAK